MPRTAVYRAAAAGRPLWIFLHDKGPVEQLRKVSPGDGISPRAAARIARRGGAHEPESDHPVFAPYRDSLIAAGVRIQAESRWFNAVAGRIDSAGVDRVASLTFVDSLCPVALFTRPRQEDGGALPRLEKPALPPPGTNDYGTSLSQIAAIQVDSLHKLGLDGNGVRIGFLDTGFSLDIDAFSSLDLIGMRDFIHGDDDVGDGDTVAMRHGTGTLSVCGGWAPGELIGVAYDAEYVVAKTELTNDEIQIEESYWVAGLEWLDSMGCDLVSSSLGYTNWYTDADYDGMTAISTLAADHAAARGLLVVNAVGNSGCDGDRIHIIVPADGDSVLAVGASDHDGETVIFSSCGPTSDGRIKPDVMAPGVRVWSADPRNGQYGYSSGTSFATPLVAGVCALLLQMDPSLTPLGLIELLRSTATKARKPMNTYGWGMVQAVRAASLLDTTPEPGYQDIAVWPNPADSQITIALPDQDSAANWRVEVYTAAGQPVDQWDVVGYDRTSWPGTNSNGLPVAAGVYLVRVKSPTRERIIKVAWMPRR
ncbi:MAG: S8 family peptidase [Candidatus Zixiibacteriota bacterium]